MDSNTSEKSDNEVKQKPQHQLDGVDEKPNAIGKDLI